MPVTKISIDLKLIKDIDIEVPIKVASLILESSSLASENDKPEKLMEPNSDTKTSPSRSIVESIVFFILPEKLNLNSSPGPKI